MSNAEEIEQVFAPIADTVANFAWRNRLKLEKCARGNASWELTPAQMRRRHDLFVVGVRSNGWVRNWLRMAISVFRNVTAVFAFSEDVSGAYFSR